MRILVDIGKPELEALDKLARTENVSRASLIRAAVSDYLGRKASRQHATAFGLWAQNPVNALELQEKMRSEWSKSEW